MVFNVYIDVHFLLRLVDKAPNNIRWGMKCLKTPRIIIYCYCLWDIATLAGARAHTHSHTRFL